MFWLKACPRCRGDLLHQSDNYGAYVSCIQCGYVLRPEEEGLFISRLGPPAFKQATPTGRAA